PRPWGGGVPPPSRARPHPATPQRRNPRMGSSPTLAHPDPTRDLEDISTHPALQQRTAATQPTTRDREQTFDRLNPDYGVPADPHNPDGHQALRDREAALALGTRVAVASSREKDPNPVMWLGAQA